VSSSDVRAPVRALRKLWLASTTICRRCCWACQRVDFHGLMFPVQCAARMSDALCEVCYAMRVTCSTQVRWAGI
jgi:hypothetical protein